MASEASLLDAPPRGLGAEPRAARSRPRSLAVDSVLLAALVAAVAIVFGLLHAQLVTQSDAAQARALPNAVSSHPGAEAITFSFGPFLAVLIGSVCLAALRHRIAAFGVFLLAAATPLTQALLHVLPADRGSFFRVAPNPLGIGWVAFNSRPQAGALWRAAAIDHGLALLPAIAIAAWTLSAETRPAVTTSFGNAVVRIRTTTSADMAGLASALFLFWLVLHTWDLRETLRGTVTSGIETDLVAFFPFFLLGAVLARGGRLRFVALAAVPILWSTLWVPNLIAGAVHGPSWSDTHQAIPFVAVVAAGALRQPIASVIDRGTTRAWVLAVSLNVLNVADVLFTRAALHSGGATEANPFAAWMGPGLKICGVGAASALLARYRPRALVWLVLVFGALIAWHLSGLVLDTS